jgi:pyrophosphatase PpaX
VTLEAILFDLDGTLLDSERAICESGVLAFAGIGVTTTELAVADHLGAPLEELFAVLAPGRDAATYARFLALYVEHHDEHPERFPPPLPGVVAGLAQAARLAPRFAVATTKPTHRAREQLEAAHLLASFAHVQGTEPPLRPKPAPDVLVAACTALRIDPRTTWMVGDTPRDVGAAHAAGAKAIVVAYTDARAQLAHSFGADAVVRSLEELPDLVTKLGA